MRSRDDRDSGGSPILNFILVMVFQMVLSLLGMFVVSWYSRRREFRADAGGAQLAGRENMIDALQALQRVHDPQLAAAEARHSQGFQTFKISGMQGGLLALLSTHPPLEERITRLEQAGG